ncbi:MAG TPA: GAF domain-containing protein, partial [Caulobacteraceae bacterium]|nr:GAF domain-containing protein [Caulobacteraceae bacterium]
MREGEGVFQANESPETDDLADRVSTLTSPLFVSDQRGRVTYLNLAALAFGPSALEGVSEVAEEIEPAPMLTINPRERSLGGDVDLRVDVSEFRRVQRDLARIAEDQAVLYRFTDRLYRAQRLHDVYEAALEAICAGLRCQRASILLFDQHAVMRFVAWRGLSSGYRTTVSGHTPWRPGEVDPQPIWVSDILQTDEPQAIKDAVVDEGIRAAAFIPLIAGGGVVGKFMAYHPQPHDFSEAEAEFAVTIARQLGFSLEQRLASQRLTESEGQLRAMFEHAGVGMALMTDSGQVT